MAIHGKVDIKDTIAKALLRHAIPEACSDFIFYLFFALISDLICACCF